MCARRAQKCQNSTYRAAELVFQAFRCLAIARGQTAGRRGAISLAHDWIAKLSDAAHQRTNSAVRRVDFYQQIARVRCGLLVCTPHCSMTYRLGAFGARDTAAGNQNVWLSTDATLPVWICASVDTRQKKLWAILGLNIDRRSTWNIKPFGWVCFAFSKFGRKQKLPRLEWQPGIDPFWHSLLTRSQKRTPKITYLWDFPRFLYAFSLWTSKII